MVRTTCMLAIQNIYKLHLLQKFKYVFLYACAEFHETHKIGLT